MMLSILLNCLCILCQDINVFLIIRFFQGILTGNVLVFTLLLIFSRLPSERVQTIAPGGILWSDIEQYGCDRFSCRGGSRVGRLESNLRLPDIFSTIGVAHYAADA
jgi:hypothetical protein